MMKRWWILLLGIFLLVGTGCETGATQRGRKPSADWSRAIPLAESARGTVGMALAAEEGRLHLVWPEEVEDAIGLHYQQLDQEATPVVSTFLQGVDGLARAPQLAPGSDGRFHLFWLRRPDNADGWQLWHGRIDPESYRVVEQTQISSPETDVVQYALAAGPEETFSLVWDNKQEEAIYGQRLSEAEPTRVMRGESPALKFDENGRLHLLWRDGDRLLYARFDDGRFKTTTGERIANLDVAFGSVFNGPVVGIAGDYVYAFWSIFNQTGLEAGTGYTAYVSFPWAEPEAAPSERLLFSPAEDLTYQPYQGDYPLTVIVPPLPSPSGSTTYVSDPAAAAAQGDELAVAVSIEQAYRQQSAVQPALALFAGGSFKGYQMAAKTDEFSEESNLLADASGHFHLAWREGAGGRKIFYATTEPERQAAIDRLDAGDAFNLVVAGSFEAVAGLVFFPLAALWIVPGGVILGIFRLRREEASTQETTSQILILVSVVIYQALKFFFMPGILTYVPFSAWIDIPTRFHQPLITVTPLLQFGVGVLAAEWRRRRNKPEPTSPLAYFLLIVGVDAALTLLLYGVNFMGVF